MREHENQIKADMKISMEAGLEVMMQERNCSKGYIDDVDLIPLFNKTKEEFHELEQEVRIAGHYDLRRRIMLNGGEGNVNEAVKELAQKYKRIEEEAIDLLNMASMMRAKARRLRNELGFPERVNETRTSQKVG